MLKVTPNTVFLTYTGGRDTFHRYLRHQSHLIQAPPKSEIRETPLESSKRSIAGFLTNGKTVYVDKRLFEQIKDSITKWMNTHKRLYCIVN
ncbi:MAG: hypothetical protein HYZ79_06970 [Candidatus Melainabacteria bacterium]|nr:hypothetical protein [Candidatus Melainabacteria bacterium]